MKHTTDYKFRAWDYQRERMSKPFTIDSDYLFAGNGLYLLGCLFDSDTDDPECIENCYIMQCSGVKDVNGDEAYEDDIVKTDYGTGKVVFKGGCFMIEWTDDCFNELLFSDGKAKRDFEIIGNIYKNSDLLKYES